MKNSSEAVASIAALKDGLRRNIYQFIRRSRRAVTREEVANDAGISTKLAAFHLDQLVDRGLLTTYYARPPGRSGPGAGRTAKFYEPSDVEIQVSIPARDYRLAGKLLVEAVKSQRPGESAHDAALRVARDSGVRLAEDLRKALGGGRVGAERALSSIESLLEQHGYEPYRPHKGEIRLRNCPFHHLSQQAPDLICGMNHALVEGVTRGLGNQSLQVLLEPSSPNCCVCLRSPSASTPKS